MTVQQGVQDEHRVVSNASDHKRAPSLSVFRKQPCPEEERKLEVYKMNVCVRDGAVGCGDHRKSA